MTMLENIREPRDLKALPEERLAELAEEIRHFLVQCRRPHRRPSGAQPGRGRADHRPAPRLRLTRRPHPVGHRPPGYVHKLLTGRQDFSKLRAKGGLSGYPSRAESEHDVIENSHASTVLGWADGLAKANQVRGRTTMWSPSSGTAR